MMLDGMVDLSASATQTAFGRLVGISQPAVHHQVQKGILPAGGTLGDWLLAYCENLRTQASGRGGEDQYDLTKQKARQAEADANLKELEYWTRIGKLVAVEDLQPLMESWSVSARASIENAVERLVTAIESQHGLEIDRSTIDASLAVAYDAIAAYPTRSGNVDAVGESEMVASEEGSNP